MRFLILTQYYPPEIGAAQLRLAALAHELRRSGHEVEVVTALPNYPSGRLAPADRLRPFRRETIDGVRVTRLWLAAATGAGLRRLLSYVTFSATAYVGGVAVRRPDVVFVESPPLFLGIAGWAVARKHGAALILNVSDLWPDSVAELGILHPGRLLTAAEWLERWLYRRADAVTAVTEGIRERLKVGKGVGERVLYLPNGVDTETFVARERVLPDPDTRPAFVYAGNHGFAQALDVILDAAAVAPELDFVLIGDGSDKARLERRSAELGLDNVTFVPPAPPAEVARFYTNAIAGIASLRNVPLMDAARPAKLLAIMSCGRPVLYAGRGEGAAMVDRAGAGIVVPPEDGAALAGAARRLAADAALARRMGRNGREFIEREHAWRDLVTTWLSDLETVRRQRLAT